MNPLDCDGGRAFACRMILSWDSNGDDFHKVFGERTDEELLEIIETTDAFVRKYSELSGKYWQWSQHAISALRNWANGDVR